MSSSKVQPKEQGDRIFCFVYGAMSNPTSRKRRNIQTVSVQPAALLDYRITFGQGGAATIISKRGWTVHGVLVECKTTQDLDLLQEIGAEHERLEMQVYPYSDEDESETANDSVSAQVYVMTAIPAETDELPQERYVRIIGEGLRYHGIDEEYIDYQIMNANYEPYPTELLTFPESTNKRRDLQISYKTYLSKSSKHLWFLVGNKVIEIQEPRRRLSTDDAFLEWARNELVGKSDSTFFMLQLMYDPSLPVCKTPDEVQQDHIEWAEHQLVEKFQESNVTAAAVGVVLDEETLANNRKSVLHTLSEKWSDSFSSLKL